MNETLVGEAIAAFAQGNLDALDVIEQASKEDLDALSSNAHPYYLRRSVLAEVLRHVSLDVPSQRRLLAWAQFWREGLLPGQVAGASPSFETDWEQDAGYTMNEVMGTLLELGDEDVGWLDEVQRRTMLDALDDGTL